MERLYGWVDADDPEPERRFSGRRATKLLGVVVISSMLGALPMLLLNLGLEQGKRAAEEEKKQQQIRMLEADMWRAVDEGKAGEATRRLLGVDHSAPARPWTPKGETKPGKE